MNRRKTLHDLSCIAKSLRPLAVAIDKLLPDPANARTHGSKNLDAIMGSLRTYGQQKPVVVRKETMTVVAGNGTLEAAKLLGWTHLAASVVEMDATTATAFAIADNRTAELAEWDTEALDKLLASIPQGTDELIDRMLADLRKQELPPVPIVEDEAPDPPKVAITKPGDLYLLGEHRLLCGDSTKAEDMARVMGGEKAGLMNTDPPYGVDYQGGRNPVSNTPREKLAGDQGTAMYAACLSVAPLLDSAPIYFWFAGAVGEPVYQAVRQGGYKVRAMVLWNKLDAHYGNFMAQYMQRHEPCLYCVKKPPPWFGPTNEVTVWDVKQPTINEFHPTQKPVELFAIPMRNHLKEGELAYEPFAGSGSQFIAAEQLSRRCFGLEIEPRYCDVIVARWEKFTGKKARRE